MENQSSKIIFLKTRSLAGRLSVAFEFIEKNFKVLFKFSALFCLPIGIITSLFYVLLGDPSLVLSAKLTLSPEMYRYFAIFMLFTLLVLFGSFCMKSMTYTLLKEYPLHNSIADLTFKQIKNQLVDNLKRLFVISSVLIFFCALYFTLFITLVLMNLWFLILVIPVFFYLIIPFSYIQEVYMFEKVSVKVAIRKGFVLGTANWGTTLLLALLASIFVLFIQAVVCLPWGIGRLVQSLAFNSTLDGNISNLPSYFIFLMFIFGVIAFFFTYLAQLYPSIAMSFQYFSAKQKEIEKEALKQQMQQTDQTL